MYTIFKTIRQIYPIETKVVPIYEADPQGFQGTSDHGHKLTGNKGTEGKYKLETWEQKAVPLVFCGTGNTKIGAKKYF